MSWNSQDSLYHHGILGQKWGVRRYQNEDGTLTPAGKKRYSISELKNMRNQVVEYNTKKQKIVQNANRERSKAYDDYTDKFDAIYKSDHRDSKKRDAAEKLDSELEKRWNEIDADAQAKNQKLSADLREKYGVDLEISQKAINTGAAPYRLAVSLVADMFRKR